MTSTTLYSPATARSARKASTSAAVSTRRLWAGRIVTALPVLFMLFDSAIKFSGVEEVTESVLRLGLPVAIAPALGILSLCCLALYLIPRTSFLGAILLTGYLGGAVAIHVRVGDPLFSHILFPTYIGALLWVGLALRDRRIGALLTDRR